MYLAMAVVAADATLWRAGSVSSMLFGLFRPTLGEAPTSGRAPPARGRTWRL